MIGTPLDVLPYVRGIQMVLSRYEGYTKGKRRDADKLIRDEIVRASGRARAHIINIHDSSFKDGAIPIARAAKAACTEIDVLIEDVNKATTGMNHAFFSGNRSASNSDLKKLIKHDHDVIDMVTKSVNIANSAELAFNSGSEHDEIIKLIRQCQQMTTSCRGFFGSRTTILGGLRQKSKKK
ncbi:MAG: hypothetical protein CL978_06690 [Euryarchaeota archaeon]|nr:hypothetical protein [Euryarchaeota archaeon]